MSGVVKILRGLPGSGKSYWAREYALQHPKTLIVSADYYRIQPDGRYQFNASRVREAHDFCLRRFWTLMWEGELDVPVIVDNTNISAWEIAPYYRLAEISNREVEIVTFATPLKTCLERQTHGVPEVTMGMMAQRLATEVLPFFWKEGRMVTSFGDKK